ncbi:MAG: tetratricopeptide repeat protein [Bacteroidales bacterium]|nr:tetratricopeptide repeat protein [Bacteroidales bacterium]
MKPKPAAVKPVPEKVTNENLILYLAIIIVLAIITFSPVFNAGFVNWDDDHYVIRNQTIQSAANIGKIIREPVLGNFHPLTMLSLAVDYWISGGKPGWFHIVNLLLHLVNITLVFFFIYKLSGQKKWIAAITALLFAIHPLHVESVAWISERKDLLYSMFFLGGLILYLDYLKKNSRATLAGVFFLFLLSLLSKPAAVVFPLVLLAIDFYFDRLKQGRTYIEKIPFFALSILFGIITLQVQKESGAYSDAALFPLASRVLFGNYGIMMYLIKTFFPFRLCAFYPFPAVNVTLPVVYYLSVLFTAALIVLFVITVKRRKEIAFALLFYAINLLLVLQFFPVGSAVIADRYSYIPLLGPFFLIGYYIQQYVDIKKGKISFIAGSLMIVVVLSLVIISRKQASTWKDGGTLWDQAIKVAPSSKAYANRGLIFKQEGNIKNALEMFSQAIAMDALETDALINRANIYFSQQKYISAIDDYTRCIAVEPENRLAFENRAAAYLETGMADSALHDLNRAVEIDPASVNAYKLRGTLFLRTNRYPQSIEDYMKCISLDAERKDEYWYWIGYSYDKMGYLPEAVDAYSKAIALSGRGKYYYARAGSYYRSGDISKARTDMKKALGLGVQGDPELMKALGMVP